jgi:hypothetical protein
MWQKLKNYFFIVLVVVILIEGFTIMSPYFKQDTTFREGVIREQVLNCINRGGWLSREKQSCFQQLSQSLIKRYEIKSIEKELAAIYEPEFLTLCHEFVHYLGADLYKAKNNLAEAFINGSSLCDSGMFHGIMEGYIQVETTGQTNPLQRLPEIASHACDGLNNHPAVSPGMYSLCFHGLGHGLMAVLDYELPTALSYCDKAAQNFIGSCYTGVFMENNTTAAFPEWSNHLSKYTGSLKDPTYPCRILDKKYLENCYRHQAVALLADIRFDYKEGFKLCTLFPPQYQDICVIGMSNNIPGPHIDTVGVEQTCRLALDIDERTYTLCLKGALQQLVQFHTGNPLPAVEFCSSAVEDKQPDCWQEAAIQVSSWVPDNGRNQNICKDFPEGIPRSQCLSTF